MNPWIKLSIALTPRKPAATRGTDGAIATNAPIEAIFAPNRDPLMRCFPGSCSGREDMRPANFKNATMEPVKVMPPNIRVKLG